MFNLVPWKKKLDEPAPPAVRDWHPLARFRQEFDQLLGSSWRDWPDPGFQLSPWNGLEVEDREDELVIRAEAPGFEPDEFDVQIAGNYLTLKAEHKEESTDDGRSSYRYGRFQRVVPLPTGIDPEKVEAKYHSGILTLRVPKTEAAKGRRIAVQQ
jgi:HSP20 family protein